MRSKAVFTQQINACFTILQQQYEIIKQIVDLMDAKTTTDGDITTLKENVANLSTIVSTNTSEIQNIKTGEVDFSGAHVYNANNGTATASQLYINGTNSPNNTETLMKYIPDDRNENENVSLQYADNMLYFYFNDDKHVSIKPDYIDIGSASISITHPEGAPKASFSLPNAGGTIITDRNLQAQVAPYLPKISLHSFTLLNNSSSAVYQFYTFNDYFDIDTAWEAIKTGKAWVGPLSNYNSNIFNVGIYLTVFSDNSTIGAVITTNTTNGFLTEKPDKEYFSFKRIF